VAGPPAERPTGVLTARRRSTLSPSGSKTLLETVTNVLVAGPATGSQATASALVRLIAGSVFVVFGAGKFTNHASEIASFHTYGLPSPDTFVAAVGVVELVGGGLLIAGLATRVVALVLAGDMVGAIIVSGIGQGEAISLTLAPALLAGMLFVLRIGPGRLSLDRRLIDTRLGPDRSD
jgi:putative oxidoreductase